jgi:MFS family permease
MTQRRPCGGTHDFTLLWVAQTISELGSRMSLFVFPLLAWQLSHSTVTAAVVEGLYLLGAAGALLPGGVLADRADRRRVMRVTSGGSAALYVGLAVCTASGALTLPVLGGVALLTGVGSGVFVPAEMSAVRSVVPDERLATALSRIQAREQAATLSGAPLGGLLYSAARSLPFGADALTYAVSWVLLGRLRTDLPPEADDAPRAKAWEDVVEGVGFTLRHPVLRTVMLWSSSLNLLVNAVVFVAVLSLISAGFHPATIGLVETVVGVSGLLGAVAAPWIIERVPTGLLATAAGWTLVPIAIPMALWTHPAVVAASFGMGMFLIPSANAGIGSYRMALTPPRFQGRVVSAARFLSTSTMPLAPVVGGTLMGWLGGAAAIATLGALTGGVALLVTLSRFVRGVPRPAVWQEQLREAAADSLVVRDGSRGHR